MSLNYDQIYLDLLDLNLPINLITMQTKIFKNSQSIKMKVYFNSEKDFNEFCLGIHKKNINFNGTFSDGINIILYDKNILGNYLETFDFLNNLRFPSNTNTIKLFTEFETTRTVQINIIKILQKKFGYDYIKLNLPVTLTKLIIKGINIYCMDILPTSLKILDLSETNIVNGLDWLPSSLETLYLNHKMINWFRLENLPSSLKSIYVDNLFFNSTEKFNKWICSYKKK